MKNNFLNSEVFSYNWPANIWKKLLTIKGLTLPPSYFFKDGMLESITQSVKDSIPKGTWGSRDDTEMNDFVAQDIKISIEWITNQYINNAFPGFPQTSIENRLSFSSSQTLFFLLRHIIKKGYLGTKKKAKELLMSPNVKGNFWYVTHTKNVELLFS